MTGSEAQAQSPDGRRARAADWFARKRSGLMSAEEARALEVWLDEAGDNRAALESVQQMWAAVEAIRADPTVLTIREQALRPDAGVSRAFMRGAIAASLVLAVAGAGAAWFRPASLPRLFPSPVEAEYRTALGQTTTVALPDGSRITLDTNTVLRTAQSRRERRVELQQGRAYFRVAKDASRPFMVTAGGKTVTATGTAFDVRLNPGGVEVTLAEGKVRVEAPLASGGDGFSRYVQTAEMTAGSRLVASDDRPWSLSRIDVARATSWTAGQLVFADQPLGEVAAELNRYSLKKIIVPDARLARSPISGSFRTGDVEGFVRAVRGYRLVRVRTDTPTSVELVAAR